MEVIIVAKTKMLKSNCIEGIFIQNKKFVRLLDTHECNQAGGCPFEIGQIWDIEFKNRIDCCPPHVEDIIVYGQKYIKSYSKLDLAKSIKQKLSNKIWRGHPKVLFDGLLAFTKRGSGYLEKGMMMPQNSVGFWIADKDLRIRKILQGTKIKYKYDYLLRTSWWKKQKMSLTYVGTEQPIAQISKGTLLRISLARWWSPKGSDIEERCYLQLSGWY